MFLYKRFHNEGPPATGRGAGRRVRRVQPDVSGSDDRRVIASADATGRVKDGNLGV